MLSTLIPPTAMNNSFHRSHLIVRGVRSRDSGRYRCSSDLSGEAHVDVAVIDDKMSRVEPAAAAAASEETAVSAAGFVHLAQDMSRSLLLTLLIVGCWN